MDARAAAAVETARKESRGMTAGHLQGIEKFEAELWKIADNLRANSNLASNEYFMPIMGLIFLRQATNRYYAAQGRDRGRQGRRARCPTGRWWRPTSRAAAR